MDFDTDPVVQRVVSAAGAPRPQTNAVSSVFAMGGVAEPDELQEAAESPQIARAGRPIIGMAARCVQTLDACGPMSVAQLVDVTGFAVAQVRDVCINGCSRGYLGRERPADGGAMRYSALPGAVERARPCVRPEPPKSGFKQWLEKKGATSAEGRAPRVKSAAAERPAPAVLPAAVVTPPGWRWGVFSDGALLIEIKGNDGLELSADQARSLKRFLAQMYPEQGAAQ